MRCSDDKLEIVKTCLQSPELLEWYTTEHGLNVEELTAQSVRTYGMGGHGNLADMIIADGVKAGLVPQEANEHALNFDLFGVH